MRLLLILSLLQAVKGADDPPLFNVYYGPAQPCCDYQSWPKVPPGCTLNVDTGLITCGSDLPAGAVTSVSATVQ